MSWQAACFILLGVVLVGGFGWYERSRPPSQVVALVAAMAALAVAGRLALAPIPNVVATTDIVLFTGYAVGAGPGFATGALAGLVSNFWLGQGPWTPWQMAGWGLVGVFGAVLAIASRRRLGRIQLAAACGVAGIAYGALLNLSLMVTYGGEFSLDRFLVLSGRAIPFDLAHAGGNVVIALAAGPALVRMLIRFRERFEVAWEERGAERPPSGPRLAAPGFATLLAALLVAVAIVPATASAGPGPGAGATWLKKQQNADGGFPASPGGSSSIAMTGWASLGLEAAGVNPLDVSNESQTPIAYLRRNASKISGTGDLERTILALVGAGSNPRSFGGRNLVGALAAKRSSSGSYGGQVNLTAFGVLAMRAAGGGVGSSVSWLRNAQNGDGGWGYTRTASSDADSTGAALQAVRNGRAATDGVHYLRKARASNGGYALAGNGPVNSQSTAWAVQGLVAAGKSPGRSMGYLASVQSRDGHYRYSRSSNQTPVWVTGQVIVAAERRAFPLSKVPRNPGAAAAANGFPGASPGPASIGTPAAAAAAKAKKAKAAAADAARQRLRGLPIVPAATPTEKSKSSKALPIAGGAAALVLLLGGGYYWWRRRRKGSDAPVVPIPPATAQAAKPSVPPPAKTPPPPKKPLAVPGNGAPAKPAGNGAAAPAGNGTLGSADGRRDRDPDPKNPQGVQARSGS